MEKFSKLFDKKNKTPDELAIEAGLEKMQGLHNLKQIFGGSEIEQRKPLENIKRVTPPPYGTDYMSGDYGKSKNEVSLEEADNRLNDAYKTQQMKQLEDLEQVGEFEEPDSEANLRAAKLRALLGK